MYSIKTLSVLAFAATAFAAPTPSENNGVVARDGWSDWSSGKGWSGGNRFWNRPSESAVVTVTGYGGEAQPTAAPAQEADVTVTVQTQVATVTAPATNNQNAGGWGQPQASSAAPAPTTTAAAANNGGWSSPAASSAAAPASTGAPSVGGGGDWFDIANKWRTAGGKAAFVSDSTLIANAQKTADESVGGLKHELNPGTFAQVLAPGDSSDFESVYVGGWLCEVPSLPGLDGVCGSEAQGWDHSDGETGHADILSGSYTKIGCALSSGTGVWACDLA